MKPDLILQADILDIIFENRNKEYGAYTLRKHYNSRLVKALSGVLVLVATLFIMNSWDRGNDKLPSAGLVTVPDTIFLDTHDPIEPVPPVKPKEKIATVANPVFIIANNATDTVPTIEELAKDVAIGLKSQTGVPASSLESPPEQPTDNDQDNKVVEAAKEKPAVYLHVDMMPEFPGGQPAFIRFLAKNLHMPEEAVQSGQRIKILVRFVVGKDGELTNIEFKETHGAVFEEEVLRVMKKMPRWKPGMQNGERVAVYFNLPIIFEVPEE